MNNEQFLKKFKKALAPIAREERENIINEITSYAVDAEANLYERLGSPETLAQQYLDGETPALPLAKKALRFGKKALVLISLALLLIVIIAGIIFWWITKDAFDYANIDAKELDTTNASWQRATVNNNLSINIRRAQVAFYWSDDNQLVWNCKGEPDIGLTENSINIQRQSCLVFLPKQHHTIHTERATVVLVEPKADVDLTIKQTTLRFANNGQAYYYDIQGSRLNLSDKIKADNNATISIQVNALESTISPYHY